MKSLILIAALLLAAPAAHACDTDAFAKTWFVAWATTAGYTNVNCTAKMCGGADRWWCRQSTNAWFWDLKSPRACGTNLPDGGTTNYQVWHDFGTGWSYAGANFTCTCQGSNGYCNWN